MSDSFWMALFSGLPGIIAAAVAGWIAVRQAYQANAIEEIHRATNSMKDALVKAAGDAAYLQGKEDGKDHPLPTRPSDKPPTPPCERHGQDL